LFQLYEYARQKLISDLSKGRVADVPSAMQVLQEIRDAWSMIPDEVKDVT
jgi:flagellin-specific chaperone FliS